MASSQNISTKLVLGPILPTHVVPPVSTSDPIPNLRCTLSRLEHVQQHPPNRRIPPRQRRSLAQEEYQPSVTQPIRGLAGSAAILDLPVPFVPLGGLKSSPPSITDVSLHVPAQERIPHPMSKSLRTLPSLNEAKASDGERLQRMLEKRRHYQEVYTRHVQQCVHRVRELERKLYDREVVRISPLERPSLQPHSEKLLRSCTWATVLAHIRLARLIQRMNVHCRAVRVLEEAAFARICFKIRQRQQRAARRLQCFLRRVYRSPVALLQTVPLYEQWPEHAVRVLARSPGLRWARFPPGSFLVYHGEPYQGMILIESGTVEVLARGDTTAKNGRRAVGVVAGTLTAGGAFGESGLVVHPGIYPNSVRCLGFVTVWYIHRKDYLRVLLNWVPLRGRVRPSSLVGVAVEASNGAASSGGDGHGVPLDDAMIRSRASLYQHIRRHWIFATCPEDMLHRIVEKATRCTFPVGEPLAAVGETHNQSLLFLVAGTCVVQSALYTETEAGIGDCIGLEECICGDRSHARVTASSDVEAWMLPKEEVMENMLRAPVLYHRLMLECNVHRTDRFQKPTIAAWLSLWLGTHVTPSLARSLYRVATPCVFGRGESVTSSGNLVRGLIVLFHGSLRKVLGTRSTELLSTPVILGLTEFLAAGGEGGGHITWAHTHRAVTRSFGYLITIAQYSAVLSGNNTTTSA